MKKLIFALIVGIAVAANAPANAQTDLQCGFPACNISVELNPVLVVNNIPKYIEFGTCYTNALGHWNTQKEIAWDEFKSGSLAVGGGLATAKCYLGRLRFKSIQGFLDSVASKLVPKYCVVKVAGAAVASEVGLIWYYRQQINRLCREHDENVRACARIIDPNFTECKL